MKFSIHNRFTGAVQFTADINCADDAPLAILAFIEARAKAGMK